MFKRMLCLMLSIVLVAGMLVLPVSAQEEDHALVSEEDLARVDVEGQTFGDVGDYTFYEYESNNTHGTADRVYSNYTIYGVVSTNDIDYYKFVLSSRSTVILVGACSYTTLLVGIENSSGTALYAYQPDTAGSSSYTFGASMTLDAGTYYIGVISSNSYSKSYLLYLEYAAASHTHTYSNACDTTCNTCGATRTVTHSYKVATCTEPKTCSLCGITSGSALGHSYQAATCTAPETCTRCGVTVGDALDHTYSNDCDPACDRCNATREVPDHIYADVCDTTCEVCQAERIAPHSYVDACDDTCELCQSVRVAPHVYDHGCDSDCNACGFVRTPGEHQYDNACDTACNICGATREVPDHVYDHPCDKTCNNCGATRAVGDHKYTNSCDTACDYCGATRKVTHTYKKTTVKATLSKNGSITEKCTVCGKTGSKTTIKSPKTFKLSATTFAYDKKAKTPAVTVKDADGKTLKKGTDYTVSYAGGRKNVGTYKVTVKMKGKYSGTKTLTFKISPSAKTSASLLVGDTANIGAKSNTSIKYSTSNKKIATVSNKGVITAKKAGTVTISVTSGGVTQKIKVTVKDPTVKISGTKTLVIKQSTTLKAKADCKGKITWSSSNKKIATVSASGKVTAQKAGTATITAKLTYKGKSYTAKFKVTVKNPTIKVTGTNSMLLKKSVTLKATTNCSGKITWSSSNKSIATVSSSGKVTGQKAGTATITAKLTYQGKTYSASFKVTVKAPYLTKTSASIEKGKTVQISVKGGSGTITYTSGNKSVATVSSSGVVTGVKQGTCTITVKRNGYSMSFKVTVKEKDYSKITLYEDSNVRISFKSAEKDKYYDDEAELYFYVQNKTGKTLLIQADAVSLNGYSFCNLTMSDPVTPYSTGIVNVTVNEFDYNLVNVNSITSVGGQFRIIDDATRKSYDAMFPNVRLDGKGTYTRTTAPNDKLLYSDSNCAIYYKSIREDKYYDDEAELYLYVVNKTGKTLLIQADAITVNGYGHSDLTMSDPVIPGSVGIVNITIDDFYYGGISLNNIRTIGGQLRIIDDATRETYRAVFTNVSVN